MWSIIVVFWSALAASVSCQSDVSEADYRLPRDVQAVDYRIQIVPDADRGTFSASVTFTFTALVDFLECVVMNSHDLDYDYASLRLWESVTRSPVTLTKIELQPDIQRVVLYPAQPLNAGYTYVFSASYKGVISDDGTGVYRTQYKDSNGFDRLE